ncbi:hypothetical protein [Kitasatospora sp. NPDC058190]|uniref:hypothetical protein n=1 Tax=Kitasatospora sp. NPDC058190 TaxID=3346371 RepID=UPI0036D7DF4F
MQDLIVGAGRPPSSWAVSSPSSGRWVTLLGYFAGIAYARMREWSAGSPPAIVVITAVALLVWYLRRHRSRDHEPSDDSGGRNP